MDVVVYLVEDHLPSLEYFAWTLSEAGYDVRSFSQPKDVVLHFESRLPSCLVLDLVLPEGNAVSLYKDLARNRACRSPYSVISGRGTVSDAVQAMKCGAIDFLEKPIEGPRLVKCVEKMIQLERNRRSIEHGKSDLLHRLATLTSRERDILGHVVQGELSKNIGAHFGISGKTVDVHRSNINRKLGVDGTVQLVRRLHDFDIKVG